MISVQEQNFYRNIRDISKSLESIAKSLKSLKDLKDFDETAQKAVKAYEQITAMERTASNQKDYLDEEAFKE